jgi:propanol-preferring alcohol dehydrogenase
LATADRLDALTPGATAKDLRVAIDEATDASRTPRPPEDPRRSAGLDDPAPVASRRAARGTFHIVHALRLDVPGPAASDRLRLVEHRDLEPQPDEIVLSVAACAVCRTDLQLVEGDLVASRLPIVPGHQAVGRVVGLGSDVRDWAPGDRAGVAWLASACGHCAACTSGRENLCPDARFTGWDRDGGYATLISVRADFALRIPDAFDDVSAAPLLCGGVIGYRSLRVSGIEPGGRLGLYGFGASALLALQVARHWGCEVHVRTRSVREQTRATEFGASSAAAYDEPTPPLDAAITFAPSGDVVVAALRCLGRGGTVAINAIHLDRIPQFPYELLWWERALRSVANFTRRDAREFLDLAAAIPIRTETQLFALAEGNDALRRLAAGELEATAVLVMNGEGDESR